MQRFYNDSGLTAKRSYRLLAAGLTAIVVTFASCGTKASIPLDDAYIWNDKTPVITSSGSPNSTSSSPAQSAYSEPKAPSLEFINVQDTTITVRIKR